MAEKSNIFERILQLAQLKGIKNIPDLADRLGYNNPEKLYRLNRNPLAKPSCDIIEDITNKFEDWNIRYILTGKGEPLIKVGVDYAFTPDINNELLDIDHSYGQIPPPLKLDISQNKLHPTLHPTLEFWHQVTLRVIRIDEDGCFVAKSLTPALIELRPGSMFEVCYAGKTGLQSLNSLITRQNNLEADITEVMRILREAGLK